MIQIKVNKNGIVVDGHAGYEEIGKDIVCAAISVLTTSLIRSLEELTEDQIEYDMGPGHAEIKHEKLSSAGKILVDSFFLAVCDIANDYPMYVKIA